MQEQKKLTYYLAYLTEQTLFAYGEYYEFFRMYDGKKKKWVISKIPFSLMLHDFRCNEISEEEAEEITGGNLPENDYKKYCDMLSGRK